MKCCLCKKPSKTWVHRLLGMLLVVVYLAGFSVLWPVSGFAAPPYYYLSPVVFGPNPVTPTWHVALSSLVSNYAAIIPSNPDGTPRFSWGCVYTLDTPTQSFASNVPLPLVSLADTLGLTTLQRAALQTILTAKGVDITLSASTTLGSVVSAVCQHLEPSFLIEDFAVGNRGVRARSSGNTVIFADTFTNAAVSISTAGGEYGLWSSKDGLFSIANNQLTDPLPYTNPKTMVNLTSVGASANYYVAATVQHTENANRDIGVYGRMSDLSDASANAYYVQVIGIGNGLRLFKVVSGSTTILADWPWTNDTTVRRLVLGMQGSTISVRWDGLASLITSEVISLPDSGVTMPGYGGVRMNGANKPYVQKIDNFCIATTTAEADTAAGCVAAAAAQTAPGVVIGEPGIF